MQLTKMKVGAEYLREHYAVCYIGNQDESNLSKCKTISLFGYFNIPNQTFYNTHNNRKWYSNTVYTVTLIVAAD
jgi:hypothetical protein